MLSGDNWMGVGAIELWGVKIAYQRFYELKIDFAELRGGANQEVNCVSTLRS
jgi:hypothetical protein